MQELEEKKGTVTEGGRGKNEMVKEEIQRNKSRGDIKEGSTRGEVTG